MSWQWMVLIASFLITPTLSIIYVEKLYEKGTKNRIIGEILAILLALIWIGFFVGRCGVSWWKPNLSETYPLTPFPFLRVLPQMSF